MDTPTRTPQPWRKGRLTHPAPVRGCPSSTALTVWTAPAAGLFLSNRATPRTPWALPPPRLATHLAAGVEGGGVSESKGTHVWETRAPRTGGSFTSGIPGTINQTRCSCGPWARRADVAALYPSSPQPAVPRTQLLRRHPGAGALPTIGESGAPTRASAPGAALNRGGGRRPASLARTPASGVGVASPSGGRTAQLHRPPCVPRSGQRLGGLTAHRAPLGATRRTCTGLGSRTSGSGCSPRLGGERQVRVSPS